MGRIRSKVYKMNDFSGYKMIISFLVSKLHNKDLYCKIINHVENRSLKKQEEKYKLTIYILESIINDPLQRDIFI